MIPYNFGEGGSHTPLSFSDFTPSPPLSNTISVPQLNSDIFLNPTSSSSVKNHSFTPSLRDTTWALELQVVALTTERDDMINGDNANIDPLLLPVSSIPRPTCKSHPKICFWSCSDYTIWKDSSAESHAGVCGKFNYLQDENGHNISSEMVTEIRRSMCNAWAKLFADNGWKLDRLATSTYSAWQRSYMDEQGNWKLRSSVAKRETSEDEGKLEDDSKSKKCKLKATIRGKDNNKHLKGSGSRKPESSNDTNPPTESLCSPSPGPPPSLSISQPSAHESQAPVSKSEGSHSWPPSPQVGSSDLSSDGKVLVPIEVINPLSILSLAAAGVVIPSAITRPTPTTSHMPPSATITTATNVTTASPSSKMHVSPKHNGHNSKARVLLLVVWEINSKHTGTGLAK
ncbi:hypothetical protein BS17DRAFT_769586 [Gyrodon lividus]|nr:hypothetical protein BS17DRAFT_769586 [Gyrodon lividus]